MLRSPSACFSICTTGSRYASVFPDPVAAPRITFSPDRIAGIPRDCTAVGRLMSIESSASTISGDSPRDAKPPLENRFLMILQRFRCAALMGPPGLDMRVSLSVCTRLLVQDLFCFENIEESLIRCLIWEAG
eukprot:IDg8490t1